jgi:carboxymethylenebutenolidase
MVTQSRESAPGEPTGFLAVPPGQGPWPGVLILHEGFGLNDDIRACTRRLAETGYLAFAPDLMTRGSRLRCLARAIRELSAQQGATFDDIEAARRWLLARPECGGRIGVIGFCLYGGFALLAAARSGYTVAAANYAQVPANADEVLAGICPVVASYGGRDRTLRGAPDKLETALTRLGVQHDVHSYPEAGHSFLNQHQPPLLVRIAAPAGFRAEEAADAWRRIDAFFAEHLAPMEGVHQ